MMVEETAFYNLGDAEGLGPDRRTMAVGMVHELHCLRHLQRVIEHGLKESRIEHTHHCVTYLRQWVLCSADVALEPGDFEARDFENQRVGATHTCRNWEVVYDFVNENWEDWNEYKTAREAGEL